MTFGKLRRYVLLSLLVLAAVFSAVAYALELARYLDPATSLMFDDSFMFIRYAKIWLSGHGAAWNMDEAPAYGNTSQLHFLLVLLLTASLNLPVETLSAMSSTLSALAALAWLPWFAARHSAVYASKPVVVRYGFWLCVLLPVLYWTSPWGYHSGTGMDAMLSLLMHLLLIDVVLTYGKQPQIRWLVFIPVLAYLAYLARPDNLLAAILFPMLYLVLVMKHYRAAVITLLATVVLVLVDGIFKYFYFGDYFPLAYYSKRIGFLENYGFLGEIYSSPFRTFFVFLLAAFPFWVPVIVSAKRQSVLKITVFLFPAAITLAYYFTMVAVMNYGGRYFFPFLPYFIACALVVLPEVTGVIHSRSQLLMRGCLIVVLYGLLLVADKYNYQIAKYFLPPENSICDDNNIVSYPNVLPRHPGAMANVYLAKMLESAPQGTKIAMTEHGYVGARNPQIHIIDLVGLHNHYLAHEGFTAQWLFAQEPDAIWLGHWHYTCMNSSIVDAPEFWQRYEFYPHLFAWGFALRKDSPRYPELSRLVSATWIELYPDLAMADYRRSGPLLQIDYAGNERKIRAYEEKRRLAKQR